MRKSKESKMTLSWKMTLRMSGMYREGKPMQEIANELRISRNTVHRHLDKINIKRDRYRPCYSRKGKRSLCWKGGSRRYWGKLAREALIKANIDITRCIECGELIDGNPQFHHIDGNRENNNIENLEVLCVTHHNSGSSKARHKRKRDAQGRFIKNDSERSRA